MTDWIDVSVPISERLVTWPRDPGVVLKRVSDIAAGDSSTVSVVSFGSHTGTHMDAPRHFLGDGATLDELPLDVAIGRARVLAVDGDRVTAADLAAHDLRAGERVLLRTRNSARPWWDEPFREDFVALTADAARHVAERGVRLLGVDYLSVSAFHDDAAGVHRPLLAGGVWIIEGLNLTEVAPGDYEMACLPMALSGADGAPTRVVLRATAPSLP